MAGKKSKIYEIEEDQFRKIVAESYSESECLRKIGLGTKGKHNRFKFRDRCEELKIDTSHFTNHNVQKYRNNSSINTKDLIVKNSKHYNYSRLKRRLIEEKLLEYKCEECGNTGEWNGKTLVLQLHHKDGDNRNNELSNLAFLCPNCHSQTENFAGKSKKKEQNHCKICNKEINKRYTLCKECHIKYLKEHPFNDSSKNAEKSKEFYSLFQEEIIDLYINKKESLYNIGVKYNVSTMCIKNLLLKNNIKLRTANEHQKKEIFCIDRNSNKILYKFNSIMEAEKFFNKSKSNIGEVCSKKRKTSIGYKWLFAKDYPQYLVGDIVSEECFT